MRALFWLVAVFAAAVALAIFGRSQESYALLVYPPWRIEISLLLFVVGLLAAFALAYSVIRLVHHALELPVHVRAYRERRRRERAQVALASALQAYLEGRFARAEKEARLAWEDGAMRGLAAIVAARAAHELGETARREQWLERAGAAGESIQAARLVSQAEFALDERDFPGARDALRTLHGSGPRHIATLRMLLRAERGAQNWEEVVRLARLLAKRGAIAPAVAAEHQAQAWVELLGRAASDRRGFEECWRRIPGDDQLQPRVALAGARHASALGNAPLAREIIERALAREWDASLAGAYGELPPLEAADRGREARTRIERAERWLAARPEEPLLLAALGRLCAHAELWGQAQRYLEASLAFESSRASHLELARLLERLGQPAEAAEHYRKAAEIG
ncbi:MAG: heme biosynthesis protein HemY [Betaproteobacteria bacterium]|nr:MAG: heme biosynthesis protein HemY [Betaproteobacteria bacterium]